MIGGCALLLWCLAAFALPAVAGAEQAGQPSSSDAGRLDVGGFHSCALLESGAVRCWGFGADGQLGYASTNSVGDDETPSAVGPVNLGAGRTATAISAGDSHTCALLDDGTVRCWGFGINGRLGYASQSNVGDDEPPGSVGPVSLPRRATAIAAGGGHTCAILDDGTVRCWGYGNNGQLGYGDTNTVGDDEPPSSRGPVDLGMGRTALAITAGELHTCALLDDHTVRCWGYGQRASLGYGGTTNIGDNETPGSVGPVNLGTGRTAKAIAAGDFHTCAILDTGALRCWGFNQDGQLGYGNVDAIGDDPNETPNTVGPVNLGAHTALAITAGSAHTCVVLDDRSVRCWGSGADGRLGSGSTASAGDAPASTPDKLAPVNLGAGRTALAVSAGASHTCARLDTAAVRCWGSGAGGRLGYCNTASIGDDEPPAAVGPVDFGAPGGGVTCPVPPGSGPSTSAATAIASPQSSGGTASPPAASDAARARGLRSCLSAVAARARRERRLAARGSARRRARARREISGRIRSGRRRCLRLFARVPGRVTGLRARAIGGRQVELSFNAAGTDGTHPPPARSYVVKQSLRPIRTARNFARAQTLCRGVCRFTVSSVGDTVTLTVTDLQPRAVYYYALAARDNVSARRGPFSSSGGVRAR